MLHPLALLNAPQNLAALHLGTCFKLRDKVPLFFPLQSRLFFTTLYKSTASLLQPYQGTLNTVIDLTHQPGSQLNRKGHTTAINWISRSNARSTLIYLYSRMGSGQFNYLTYQTDLADMD